MRYKQRMMDPNEIARLVKAALPGAEVAVRDLTGGRDHFELVVVSALFAGKPTLARHRMVYAPLGEALAGPIHALTLRTLTPDETT
jgi:acid stress-induced BolA-like protein IbaG/YrbA